MISNIRVRNIITKGFFFNGNLGGVLRRSNTGNATTNAPIANENNKSTQTNDSEKLNSKNDNENDYYDIVVCGGGMVGTSMVAALGYESIFKNLKIALIESLPKSKNFVSTSLHSNRTCALNEQTVNFFKKIGSYDFIEKNRFGTVKYMHVWDSRSDASISFQNPDGSNLAIIVENNLIQESLSRNLESYSNVNVIYSTQIKEFNHVDQFVEIKLNNNETLKTKLLIGADGANSFIRNNLKLSITSWNYDQIAIVATLKLAEKSQNLTAWQRFLPTGPIALLPLDDEYSSLVWSIKKEHAGKLLQSNEDEFVHQVNQAFVSDDFKNDQAFKVENLIQNGLDFIRNNIPQVKDYIVDKGSVGRLLPPKIGFCVPVSRASYPLSFLHSNNYVDNRIALVGDAVHKIHPLAGQGVNLGFNDVICLTNNLKEQLKDGSDIGSSIGLKKYEAQNQLDAYPKVFGIDFLNKLYTDQDYLITSPLVALRTIGLTISNRIDPLKNFYLKQAIK